MGAMTRETQRSQNQTAKQVRFAAHLFILAGLLAAIDTVLAPLHGGLHLNLGLIGLYVGTGLLRRSHRAWNGALVLTWLSILGIPISSFFLLSGDSSLFLLGANMGFQSDYVGLGLAWNALWIAISLWQYRTLTRPDARALFGRQPATQMRTRSWIVVCCAVPLAFLLICGLSGYRLSALGAARANRFVPRSADLIAEIDLGWGGVHVFETPDTIHAIWSHRSAFLWDSRFSSSAAVYSEDSVRTLAFSGFELRYDRQATVFAVQTSDPKIAFIEAGPDSLRISEPASLNSPIAFQWSQAGIGVHDLDAKALDFDGSVIYEYRYLHPGYFRADQLRWYPAVETADAG